MTRPETPPRRRGVVGREVAAGLEAVARDWTGRLALFTSALLVLVAGLRTDAAAGWRVAGVVAGVLVIAAVIVGWVRRAPAVVQWSVAVVGVVLTVALSVLVGRA